MQYRIVEKFSFRWQAERLVHELETFQIEARIVENPREYSSLITGISNGDYSVCVDSADLSRAQEIEKKFSTTTQLTLVTEVDSHLEKNDAPNYFRRIVLFTLLSILLPFVFNLLATWTYVKGFKSFKSTSVKIISILVLLMGWSFFAIQLYLFWNK